jgi:hypothetical protein
MNPSGPDPAAEKKPRKGELSKSDKRHNRALSRIRVRVEHALADVKRSRIVKDELRNTKELFSDLVMAVACGLHNLRVHVRKRRLKI